MALSIKDTTSLTVSELQDLKFSQLPLQDKIAIKKRGRSTPDIQISQPGISNNKKYIRSFNSDWYKRKSWLCGCEVKNSLFCFPCLLFGGDLVWTKNGFRNMNKIKEKIERHEKSKKHIDNIVSLALLGTVSMKEKHSETYKLSANEHNFKVKKNREVLSKIIDCILFCGNFETLGNAQNVRDDSVNPGVFRKLINFACKSDVDLKSNLESTVFKGVSKAIQNEILDCLLEVYHEEIKTEIRKASFVAVIADDITDVSECAEMSLSLRYVLDGEIYERFWGFYVPEKKTANGISECILEQLDIILLGNEKKLIAQTFDGMNFMKGKKAQVKEKVQAVYTNAYFILGYAHEPNAMMRSAASTAHNARIFFSNILAIPAFFSKSPQRMSILKKHMKVGMLRPSSRTMGIWSVTKVHESLKPLKNCLTEILTTSYSDETVSEATGILKNLNDNNFIFWLELFHQITPHVETIYNQIQSKEVSQLKVDESLANFKAAISKLKNSKYCDNPSKIFMAEAKEVCDNLCTDMTDRYSFIIHFLAAKLFNKKCFQNFKNSHPSEEVSLITEAYPMIDKDKLETELRVFYSRSDMYECGKLTELLKFILEHNLSEVLSETKTLIEILLTLPMTTTDNERCFSTQAKIKTFLRNTLKSEKLNPLAVLSIENDYLYCHPDMKDKIIDLFSQIKTRKIDFSLK